MDEDEKTESEELGKKGYAEEATQEELDEDKIPLELLPIWQASPFSLWLMLSVKTAYIITRFSYF